PARLAQLAHEGARGLGEERHRPLGGLAVEPDEALELASRVGDRKEPSLDLFALAGGLPEKDRSLRGAGGSRQLQDEMAKPERELVSAAESGEAPAHLAAGPHVAQHSVQAEAADVEVDGDRLESRRGRQLPNAIGDTPRRRGDVGVHRASERAGRQQPARVERVLPLLQAGARDELGQQAISEAPAFERGDLERLPFGEQVCLEAEEQTQSMLTEPARGMDEKALELV